MVCPFLLPIWIQLAFLLADDDVVKDIDTHGKTIEIGIISCKTHPAKVRRSRIAPNPFGTRCEPFEWVFRAVWDRLSPWSKILKKILKKVNNRLCIKTPPSRFHSNWTILKPCGWRSTEEVGSDTGVWSVFIKSKLFIRISTEITSSKFEFSIARPSLSCCCHWTKGSPGLHGSWAFVVLRPILNCHTTSNGFMLLYFFWIKKYGLK